MYTDDTKVYGEADSEGDINKLQSDLDSLADWAGTWQLKFNADKFRQRKSEGKMRKHGSEEKIDLLETTLEKDIGVHMDPELRFLQHLERQVNKAYRLLGLIRRSFDYLDCDAMKLLFAALVRPHLEFGNCVWAPYLEKDKKVIESVLRRATKVVDGLKDLSYEERLKRVGLPSMGYRRLRDDMIEAYKFTHCLCATQDKLFTIDSKSVTSGNSYIKL